MQDSLRHCCADLRNRSESMPVPGKPDVTVQRCLVCARRHFELTVEPGKLGLLGSGV